MSHFTLYFTQSVYPTFCVCHLSLHLRFNFFAFNIHLWFMQHSSLHFRNSTSQSNKQVFFSLEFVNILLQMEAKAVKNASSLLHFSGDRKLESGLILLAGQRPIEIVGSIDLTHPRSNGGRESIERLPSGVDSGDLLHSRHTRRRQTYSRPCDKDAPPSPRCWLHNLLV